MVLAIVCTNRGEVDEALLLLEPLHELLDSFDPLGEFSFVLSATAYLFVWIEQWVQAYCMLDRMISAARTAGAPAVLAVPLALHSDFELCRRKIAAAYAAASESAQLAVSALGETGESRERGLIAGRSPG